MFPNLGKLHGLRVPLDVVVSVSTDGPNTIQMPQALHIPTWSDVYEQQATRTRRTVTWSGRVMVPLYLMRDRVETED